MNYPTCGSKEVDRAVKIVDREPKCRKSEVGSTGVGVSVEAISIVPVRERYCQDTSTEACRIAAQKSIDPSDKFLVGLRLTSPHSVATRIKCLPLELLMQVRCSTMITIKWSPLSDHCLRN